MSMVDKWYFRGQKLCSLLEVGSMSRCVLDDNHGGKHAFVPIDYSLHEMIGVVEKVRLDRYQPSHDADFSYVQMAER